MIGDVIEGMDALEEFKEKLKTFIDKLDRPDVREHFDTLTKEEVFLLGILAGTRTSADYIEDVREKLAGYSSESFPGPPDAAKAIKKIIDSNLQKFCELITPDLRDGCILIWLSGKEHEEKGNGVQ